MICIACNAKKVLLLTLSVLERLGLKRSWLRQEGVLQAVEGHPQISRPGVKACCELLRGAADGYRPIVCSMQLSCQLSWYVAHSSETWELQRTICCTPTAIDVVSSRKD